MKFEIASNDTIIVEKEVYEKTEQRYRNSSLSYFIIPEQGFMVIVEVIDNNNHAVCACKISEMFENEFTDIHQSKMEMLTEIFCESNDSSDITSDKNYVYFLGLNQKTGKYVPLFRAKK